MGSRGGKASTRKPARRAAAENSPSGPVLTISGATRVRSNERAVSNTTFSRPPLSKARTSITTRSAFGCGASGGGGRGFSPLSTRTSCVRPGFRDEARAVGVGDCELEEGAAVFESGKHRHEIQHKVREALGAQELHERREGVGA